jgi:hypothetical protein
MDHSASTRASTAERPDHALRVAGLLALFALTVLLFATLAARSLSGVATEPGDAKPPFGLVDGSWPGSWTGNAATARPTHNTL